MLKHLFNPKTIAPIFLAIVSTTAIQANAEINLSSSASGDKLIVKGEQVTHIDAVQQSDLDGIHKTLTQFYRGINESNVDRMVRASVSVSEDERESVRNMFARLKSAGVDISVEIKNIELVSLSDRNAMVNIDQLLTVRKSNRSANSSQSASVELVKQRGRWRVSKNNTIVKSLDRR